MRKYRFNFRIGFTLLCLFFFILFCVLGVWQVHRYHYKKNLLAHYQQRQTIKVSGKYRNDLTMFIQNQIYHDQMGFEVLTPLEMSNDKKLLLIDRGWIKKIDNQVAPVIDKVSDQQNISGYKKELNEYQFILGKNILNENASPIIMQKIDINELEQITHQHYYPYILRLDAKDKNGFVRDWVITSVMPERHLGYAIQWFLMAIVLLIAYFCFSYERVSNE